MECAALVFELRVNHHLEHVIARELQELQTAPAQRRMHLWETDAAVRGAELLMQDSVPLISSLAKLCGSAQNRANRKLARKAREH
jgi:hypothetical protein